jgi:hypothetical protein
MGSGIKGRTSEFGQGLQDKEVQECVESRCVNQESEE